ncbi:MAG: lytic transglycosylase domain-containing protein [Bacteroidales bacterium]|jgi:hypothetical protein|nr:lytic transglycosylase domain-containing protein [Bacteroidales bacterium]
MNINKRVKIPFLLVIGILIGYLISTLFVFSDTIDKTEENVLDTNDNYVIPYEVFQPYIPEELTFCGEKVPLENFDVYEALDFEMIVNTYRHSSTMAYIKRANRYFPEIEKVLAEYGVPDDMKYLCVAESGLANVVSPAGAAGFWQFMKGTAGEYNMIVNKNIDERYNHSKSVTAAAQYLNGAKNKFGSWTLAAAAYNMGPSGLKKNIEAQKVSSYWDLELNQETARYVYRILSLKLIMSEPEKYGYNILEKDLYDKIPTYEITVDSTIPDLVKFAFEHDVNYKILKYFNPWLRDDHLSNPGKDKYTIILPQKGIRKCDIPKIIE